MTLRTSLARDGYAVLPAVLSERRLAALRFHAQAQLRGKLLWPEAAMPAFPLNPGTGPYRRLILHGAALLRETGFSGLRWMGGAHIPKVPGEPRRAP